MSAIYVNSIKDKTNTRELASDSGSAWSWGSGVPQHTIIQVLSFTKTDTFSESVDQGAQSGDAISLSITPSSTSSKVLIMAQLTLGLGTANKLTATLFKGGSKLDAYSGDAAGNRTRVSAYSGIHGSFRAVNLSPMYLDSPSSTSSITYSFRLNHGHAGTETVYLNKTHDDENFNYQFRSASTITLFEVAG